MPQQMSSSFEFSCAFLNIICWQWLCFISTPLFPDSLFCYMYLKVYNCSSWLEIKGYSIN